MQLSREEKIANYRISKSEGGGKCIWDISEWIQRPIQHNGAKAKVIRDIVLTYIVSHNILRTHQRGGAYSQNPQNDLLRIKKISYFVGQIKTAGIPRGWQSNSETFSRITSTRLVHWLRRRRGSINVTRGPTLGTAETGIYQSFSGLPNYSKNFPIKRFKNILSKTF